MGMSSIRSNNFKMERGRFAKFLFMFYGLPWLILFIILILLGVLLGFIFGNEWFILSLMVIFVLLPMSFAFLYFYYGLNRGCYMNVVNHIIQPVDNGLYVSLIFSKETDKKNIIESEFEKCDDEKIIDFIIPYQNIVGYKVDTKGVFFIIKGQDKGFLWLPEAAYDNSDDFAMIVNSISKQLK